MEQKIQLKISYVGMSTIDTEAYNLDLREIDGKRHFTIMIGKAEGMHLINELSNIQDSRPRTIDIYANTLTALNAKVQKVVIYKFEDNVFYAHIYISDVDGTKICIDARPSDAIILAVKSKTPIFIYETTLEKVLKELYPNSLNWEPHKRGKQNKSENVSPQLDVKQNEQQIKEELKKAIENENYERAAFLRDLLNPNRKKE